MKCILAMEGYIFVYHIYISIILLGPLESKDFTASGRPKDI